MRELAPGRVVAGFVIKELLGKGGMGEVYLVHDQKLSVDRALKIIAEDSNGGAHAKINRERFLREARVLARLRHPHIIPVHEIGQLGGHPFIVMSYFAARDGKKWMRHENADAERLRKIAVQIASALAHAHGQGVLHRDIKLTNMLIGKDDEVMLIDFGLAKSKTDAKVTRTGRAMGTYNYLAPEYVKASKVGGGEHTELTDLWAFGCLLYALTCRRTAFDADNDIKVLTLIEEERFMPVKAARPDTPDAWAQFIHELMAPDPTKRIQSAKLALQRLEALTLTPAPMTPPVFSAVPGAKPADLPPPVMIDAPPAAPPPTPNTQTVAAVQAPVAPAKADESLFDHDSNERAEVTPPTTQLAQPSFQPAPEPQSSAKSRAKKSLLLPVAAAATVLCVGGALILWADSAAETRSRSTRSAYVDPDELKRRQRGERELHELELERGRRAPVPLPQEARSSLVPIVVTPTPAASATATIEEAQAVKPKNGAATPPRRRAPERPQQKPTDDPWARRYGSRTSFNSSVAPADTMVASTTRASAPVAGVKIPVRVRDAIASAPTGPVIAFVESATKVGDIELPKNAELHGRTVGTSGPRILVEFTFAIVNGRNVSLKGTALGGDGRAGVPGAKTLGGVTDVAAGGASGALQAIVDVAASATQEPIVQGAIRGAGAPAANKTSRMDNEEQLVVANRGSRFFVYVETLSTY